MRVSTTVTCAMIVGAASSPALIAFLTIINGANPFDIDGALIVMLGLFFTGIISSCTVIFVMFKFINFYVLDDETVIIDDRSKDIL